MNDDFKIGLVIGLLIYAFGAICTIAVYQFSGWEYRHAPPAAFIPFMITLGVGGVRVLMCLFNFLVRNSLKAKGELAIHTSVGALMIVMIYYLR